MTGIPKHAEPCSRERSSKETKDYELERGCDNAVAGFSAKSSSSPDALVAEPSIGDLGGLFLAVDGANPFTPVRLLRRGTPTLTLPSPLALGYDVHHTFR
jgi:hypothetical protein